MTNQIKIYLAAAALILAVILGGSVWSHFRAVRLERKVADARQQAEAASQTAAKRELEAAEYKQKIEYLESRLAEIQTIAKKQDEELEKLNFNSGRARADVERARRVRSVTATANELCAKLAEVGYQVRTPCVSGGNER